jgi:hypothetical protein
MIAKRFKKVENATALIWKLLQAAESTFRRLKRAELLPAVYAAYSVRMGCDGLRTRRGRLPPDCEGAGVSLPGDGLEEKKGGLQYRRCRREHCRLSIAGGHARKVPRTLHLPSFCEKILTGMDRC